MNGKRHAGVDRLQPGLATRAALPALARRTSWAFAAAEARTVHVVEARSLCAPASPRLQSAGWRLWARKRAALELLERRLARHGGGSS